MRRAGVDQLVRRSVCGWRTERAQAIYSLTDAEERAEASQAVVKLVLDAQITGAR
jgi:hypothetical protein